MNVIVFDIAAIAVIGVAIWAVVYLTISEVKEKKLRKRMFLEED